MNKHTDLSKFMYLDLRAEFERRMFEDVIDCTDEELLAELGKRLKHRTDGEDGNE